MIVFALYFGFAAIGLSRGHWSGAEPIRKIFREAFEAAAADYEPAKPRRLHLVRRRSVAGRL